MLNIIEYIEIDDNEEFINNLLQKLSVKDIVNILTQDDVMLEEEFINLIILRIKNDDLKPDEAQLLLINIKQRIKIDDNEEFIKNLVQKLTTENILNILALDSDLHQYIIDLFISKIGNEELTAEEANCFLSNIIDNMIDLKDDYEQSLQFIINKLNLEEILYIINNNSFIDPVLLNILVKSVDLEFLSIDQATKFLSKIGHHGNVDGYEITDITDEMCVNHNANDLLNKIISSNLFDHDINVLRVLFRKVVKKAVSINDISELLLSCMNNNVYSKYFYKNIFKDDEVQEFFHKLVKKNVINNKQFNTFSELKLFRLVKLLINVDLFSSDLRDKIYIKSTLTIQQKIALIDYCITSDEFNGKNNFMSYLSLEVQNASDVCIEEKIKLFYSCVTSDKFEGKNDFMSYLSLEVQNASDVCIEEKIKLFYSCSTSDEFEGKNNFMSYLSLEVQNTSDVCIEEKIKLFYSCATSDEFEGKNDFMSYLSLEVQNTSGICIEQKIKLFCSCIKSDEFEGKNDFISYLSSEIKINAIDNVDAFTILEMIIKKNDMAFDDDLIDHLIFDSKDDSNDENRGGGSHAKLVHRIIESKNSKLQKEYILDYLCSDFNKDDLLYMMRDFSEDLSVQDNKKILDYFFHKLKIKLDSYGAAHILSESMKHDIDLVYENQHFVDYTTDILCAEEEMAAFFLGGCSEYKDSELFSYILHKTPNSEDLYEQIYGTSPDNDEQSTECSSHLSPLEVLTS